MEDGGWRMEDGGWRMAMVEVRLTDVFIENSHKAIFDAFGKAHSRWWASVALQLHDIGTDQRVAEWFYLIVCSEDYMKRPFRKGPTLDKRYLIVQHDLNLKAVKEIAQKRLSKIKAKDWEEFYTQMESSFLYDD